MPNPNEPAEVDCHVYVGNDFVERLPALPKEQQREQAELVEFYVSFGVWCLVVGRGGGGGGWQGARRGRRSRGWTDPNPAASARLRAAFT